MEQKLTGPRSVRVLGFSYGLNNRLVEKNVPESKTSPDTGRKRPYVNHACMNTIRVKHRKWMKYRNSMTNRNYEINKSARNKAKAEFRKTKYKYEKYLASKIKTDNKLFWSYVRSKMKTKSSLGELEMPNGDLTSDSQEKRISLTISSSVYLKMREPITYPISQTVLLLSLYIHLRSQIIFWKKQ